MLNNVTRGIAARSIYAICNVEIEVDRLERNGGNVLGLPRPSPRGGSTSLRRGQMLSRLRYESYPRRLMRSGLGYLIQEKKKRKEKNTAFVRALLERNAGEERSVSAFSFFETFRQYNRVPDLVPFRFN